MQLRDQWLWEQYFLNLYIVVPALICIFFIGILYPDIDSHSFYFILFIPMGIATRYFFSNIAKKVDILMHCKSAKNGEAVAGLVIVNQKKSPGIVILRDDVIILIPVNGRRRKYKLMNIISIKKAHTLSGCFMWGKIAFFLETSGSTDITFAVPVSVGNRWYTQLTRNT